MATQAEIAEHLDLSDRTVRELKKRGVFGADARGQLDLAACRIAYIRHLRERAAGRTSDAAEDEDLDLAKERALLAREQRERIALQNAEERGELVRIADFSSAVLAVLEMTKAKVMRVPAKVAKSDTRLKTRIADAIELALEELSLTRVLEEAGAPDDDAPEEDESDDA